MKVTIIGDDKNPTTQQIMLWLSNNDHSFSIQSSYYLSSDSVDSYFFVQYDLFSKHAILAEVQDILIYGIPPGAEALPYHCDVMFADASFEEITFRIAAALKNTAVQRDNTNTLIDAYMKTSGNLVMLVDELGIVERVNSAKSLFSYEDLDMFSLRGDIIDCVNASNGNGCGKGHNCEDCDIRKFAKNSIEKKESFFKKPSSVTVCKADGKRERITVFLSSVFLELEGKEKTLLIVSENKPESDAETKSNISLEISERQVAIAAEIADIGFFRLDSSLLTLLGNQVWKQFFDSDEDLQSFVEWSEHIDPNYYKQFIESLLLVMRGAEYAFEQTLAYINADNRSMWLHIKCFGSDYNRDGKPNSVLGIAQDISDQIASQEMLKIQQANQKALLENTSAKIWMLDPQYRIKEMNSQFRRIFNALFGVHFSMGDNFIEHLPSKYAKRWRKLIDRAFLGDVTNASESIELKNGTRYFDVRLAPVWMDDSVIAVSCYLYEVTVQKRYEEMLKQAKESAETANTAKSQFLANMSHEIRTPLNAILGFSQILEASEKQPEKQNYLQSIKKNGTMLLNIINDVLDLSKIEAGKITIKKEPTDLKMLLEEIFEPFIYRSQKKRLFFKTEIGDLQPIMVNIDGFRYRQVLLNLLSNAFKFTERGGITVNCLFHKKGDDIGDLQLQVSDTGIGISPEQIDAIFDPFMQQENQDNRKYEGTGLGLSITRQILAAMNGTIAVESKIGSGSLFTVTLPGILYSANSARPKEAISVAKNKRFRGKLAMIVDDIAEHRQVIGGYLKLYGIKTMFATGGDDLFSLLETAVPDIIFLDIRMPKMDGYAVLEILRVHQEWSSVPVVAVTAEVFAKEEAYLKEKGFVALLRKPVQLNDIHSILESYFSIHNKDRKKISLQLPAHISPDDLLAIQEKARQLEHKQPRADLFELADILASTGAKYDNKQIALLGRQLRQSAEQFNVYRIKEIIALCLNL